MSTARARRRRKIAQSDSEASSSHLHVFSNEDFGLVPEDAPGDAEVLRVSGDGRRVYVQQIQVDPPSPMKRMRREQHRPPEEPMASFLDPNADGQSADLFDLGGERYQLFTDDDTTPQRSPSPPPVIKPKRPVKPADISLHKWLSKRDAYLQAMTFRHGTGNNDVNLCPSCENKENGQAVFRCRDCFGDVLYCRTCTVEIHRKVGPLHRVSKWNGKCFVKTTLATLGLRIQFGHPPHQRCTGPEPGHVDFVCLDSTGIHTVAVDFCGCEHALAAGPPEIQLLRAGWFPATHERPQTCATFNVLKEFHQDTLQSKMTMYDFYGVLEKLTDNTGIKPPDRYHEWIRLCREYRHLALLMRGGRSMAYDFSGVEGTKQGELAIDCPACPRPGINTPEGWENASKEERFLYTIFLAMDACFRLKRRLISSELKDPDLGSGWAYLLNTMPYREYLRGVTDQKEMNSCSGLAALDFANTKFSRGYSTTGVGMGVCARHEFVQANGVGDLQRGERFANMDYIFACIMRHKHPALFTFVTYDIMCSWKVHLQERLTKLPPKIRLFIVMALMRFAIPKMHIHSHTLVCQLLYSLNLILGSAEVEGEAIERAWSGIGGVATSTRDMGPGARHDVLDCQFSYWNWQKLVGLAESLRRRVERAKEELQEQMEAFEEFSSHQMDRVPEWRELVLEYELDETKTNPFEIKVEGLTEAQVRLQFTKEEAEDAKRGLPSVHDVSPSSFIIAGLDLEEDQRRVRVQAELKKAQTTGQQIDLASMRTKLNRGIARFRKIQQTYMPAAIQVLSDLAQPANTLAEDVPLLLPSALSDAQRLRCIPGLEHLEALMRDAQCRTGLVRLRNQLHIKSRLLTYKKNQSRHQGANTRSRTIVNRNESKIRLHSEKYQTAWEAMRKLNGGDERLVGWRTLKREDIRCMEDQEDLRKKAKAREAQAAKRKTIIANRIEEGMLPAEMDDDMECDDLEPIPGVERGPENQRQVSWIWTLAGADGTDAGLEKALRVEWSKAFARTRRWTEEKRLLDEEYQRLLDSFDYEAQVWDTRALTVPIGVLSRANAEGAVAYATRHADMYRDLKTRAQKTWTEPRLRRGQKRARHVPAAVSALEAEERAESAERAALEMLHNDAEWDEDDDDDNVLRGDVESDEEYIMGGEGYDD
ncbi:hypothetical protein C8R47DRAFT_1250447 [Mycena vitilis]|nr:hypothetical protein C8R47DRAFT_1250447 [Mycena vitilis]